MTKYSKAGGKKLLVCFFISLCVVTLQYSLDRQEHLRLAMNGRIVDAISTYSKEWSGDYSHFAFTTADGRRIEHSEKCGSKEMFDKEYKNMKVIYNVNDPKDFMNLYDFVSYNHHYRLVFYFGIYLTFLTFFLYLLDRNVRGLYNYFKSRFWKQNDMQKIRS